MRTSRQIRNTLSPRTSERGSLLIETLIAMIVLAIGLGGLFSLLAASMYTNDRSGADTRSTMLAEHVIEQIDSQLANQSAPLFITDCAGTTWTINTASTAKGAGSGGSYGGNGAKLTSGGIIDWTQSYASVAPNYAMKYVACGNGGRQTTYDVRWDVITLSTYTRMSVVSARPLGNQSIHNLRFITPANLRTIGGM